ncbi:MAG: hypothetical protein IIY11_06085, partial [Clostridia bacterium]|nr:hypothetical protein [Clostridia bacterium]
RTSTRPKTGFMYMIDGADMSSGGLYTFYPQAEFTEVGSSSAPTASASSIYGEGEGFLANETVKLRLVFASGTKSPDVYINGTKLTYYNATNTTQNSGYLGLMMRACKAEFDNIKIMGTKTSEYPASELVTKLVDFTYEENFDDYVNGQLPAGWKLYEDYNGAAITPAKATASVQNGALEMKSPEWYNFAYVMLENLGEVQREGLTIEADFTRIGKPGGNENNASTGFAYMASIANGATTTDKTVIYTDKFTDNSTKQQGQSTWMR